MLRRQRSFSTTTGRLKTSWSPFSSRNGIAQPPSLSKPSSASTSAAGLSKLPMTSLRISFIPLSSILSGNERKSPESDPHSGSVRNAGQDTSFAQSLRERAHRGPLSDQDYGYIGLPAEERAFGTCFLIGQNLGC